MLIVLFAVGHTIGFLQHDPEWKVEALLASMKSTHFNIQGFNRSYWDFFVGFGFLVTVFLLLAAVLAWQLGSVARETLVQLRAVAWGFPITFVAITILSWKYFFASPLVLSSLITVCLILAAWLSERPVRD